MIAIRQQAQSANPSAMNANRIPVLMYHRVGAIQTPAEEKYCVTPARFTSHMRALASRGYRAVPLAAFMDWRELGTSLREKDFVLTFDDGFRGVLEHAAPVLAELNWPFTVFLVTDRLNDTDRWNQLSGLGGGHQLLGVEELPQLQAARCELHSHTMTHRSLTALGDQELRHELAGSLARLIELLGQGSYCLAYPYGHVDPRVETMARDVGYRAAFSVQPGFNRRDVDPFHIRRLDVFGSDTAPMLLRKIHLGSNAGGISHLCTYYLKQLMRRVGI